MHPHSPATSFLYCSRGRGAGLRRWGVVCAQRLGGHRQRFSAGEAMAMDFPVSPVDRLPFFPDEACSAAALMELVGAAGRWEAESGNGSRGAVVCGFGASSRGQAATMCYEEASVAAGGGTVSCFSEGEGDNAEAIEHGFTVPPVDVDREAMIQDRTESGDGGSAQSTCKVGPQAPGWTRAKTKFRRTSNCLLACVVAAGPWCSVEGPVHGDQLAVIQEHAESDEATSAQSTGKMDPQAPRWTKAIQL